MEGNDVSLKYEDIHLLHHERVPELSAGLGRYFPFYNEERPHQALGYRSLRRPIRRGEGAFLEA